jgi:hypothetical protein
MLQTARHSTIALAFAFAFVGCKSHEAKVANLQKQYDQLNQQFGKDCAGEFLKVPPSLSPKCSAEDKQVKAAWDRLQAERAKK